MKKTFWLLFYIIILTTCEACESPKSKMDESDNTIKIQNDSIKASVVSHSEPLLLTTESTVHPFVCYPFDALMQNNQITVKRDIDKNGKEEDFIIRLGQVGPEVLCIKDDSGVEESGEDNQCIQLSFIDLDNDGKEEIIILFGGYLDDGLIMDIYASIYKVTNTKEVAFEKIGELESMFQIILKDSIFLCPYGSQGLYNEYRYQNGQLIETD